MNQTKTPNITLYLFWFTILVSRLFFIFIDARISQASLAKQSNQKQQSIVSTNLLANNTAHSKSQKKPLNTIADAIPSTDAETSHGSSMLEDETLVDTFSNIEPNPTAVTTVDSTEPIQIQDSTNIGPTSYPAKSSITTEIQNIEDSYKETNDTTLLPWMVKKLVKSYQFDEAYRYFNMMELSDQNSDPKLHLYLLINQSSINITSLGSIQSIIPTLDSYKSQWLISTSDYNFYQGLLQIRNGNYEEANKLFQNNTDLDQQKFIKSFQKSKTDYSTTKDAPKYYLDWLISLGLMKNGYFSIAKKIALDSLSQNEKYILPYQVLAYTNFITNNTEISADYFIRLAEFDFANKESYNLLIWISYFRAEKYTEAVLYLTQVTDSKSMTDAYRYLTLAYEKLWDTANVTSYQQKLLWQPDINKTDFYTYFYQTSFAPYSLWKTFDIYNHNQQLYVLFLQKCELSSFAGSDKDICEYWKIWLDLIQGNLDSQDWKTIQYLSNLYPQSYFYQILWDISAKNSYTDQANTYYSKAIKLTSDSTEKEIIKNKITNLTNSEKPLFSKK